MKKHHLFLGSAILREQLAEKNESVAKSSVVKNIRKTLEKLEKKLRKASSLVCKSSIRSGKNIKKASNLNGQPTLSFKETKESFGQIVLESFENKINNLNIQKIQLEKQIEENRTKLVSLEKQVIDESSKDLLLVKKEEFRLEKLESKVIAIENEIAYIQTYQSKELVSVIQDNIKDNNEIHQSLNELYAENIKLEETLKYKKTKISSLKLSLQNSNSNSKYFEENNLLLKEKTKTMKNEIDKLTRDLEDLNVKFKVLLEKFKKSEAKKFKMSKLFEDLVIEKANENSKLSDISNTLKREKHDVQNSLYKAEIEKQKLEMKNSEISKKLSSKECYIKTLVTSLEACNSKAVDYEIENKTSIEKVNKLQKELNDVRKTLYNDKKNYNNLLNQKSEENRKLNSKINDLKQQNRTILASKQSKFFNLSSYYYYLLCILLVACICVHQSNPKLSSKQSDITILEESLEIKNKILKQQDDKIKILKEQDDTKKTLKERNLQKEKDQLTSEEERHNELYFKALNEILETKDDYESRIKYNNLEPSNFELKPLNSMFTSGFVPLFRFDKKSRK